MSPATKKRAGCKLSTTGKRFFSAARENIVEIGAKGRVPCAVCSRRALCVLFLKFLHAEDERTNKRTDAVTPLHPLYRVPIGGANRGCCGSRKSAPCAFFFFTGRGGFSFSRIRKRKMGAHRNACSLVQKGVYHAPFVRAMPSACRGKAKTFPQLLCFSGKLSVSGAISAFPFLRIEAKATEAVLKNHNFLFMGYYEP